MANWASQAVVGMEEEARLGHLEAVKYVSHELKGDSDLSPSTRVLLTGTIPGIIGIIGIPGIGGIPKGGGGPKDMLDTSKAEQHIVDKPKPNGGGFTPGFCPSMGFDDDCPSAAYEEVIESMTDCAFSCPISGIHQYLYSKTGRETNAGSSPQRFADDSFQYCEPCAHSWSRV